MEVLIDGQVVELEPLKFKNGNIRALKLVGPGVYNGHYHGKHREAYFCIPKVVDSVAKVSNRICPEVPEEFGPPYFASFWFDPKDSDALL